MLVSYVLMIGGLFETYSGTLAQFVPEEYRPLAITGIGFLMAVLRFWTSKPLAEK
jgi:hypothetical protein